eukprot:gene14371-11430_t
MVTNSLPIAVDNPSNKNFQADTTAPGYAVFQTCKANGVCLQVCRYRCKEGCNVFHD